MRDGDMRGYDRIDVEHLIDLSADHSALKLIYSLKRWRWKGILVREGSMGEGLTASR